MPFLYILEVPPPSTAQLTRALHSPGPRYGCEDRVHFRIALHRSLSLSGYCACFLTLPNPVLPNQEVPILFLLWFVYVRYFLRQLYWMFIISQLGKQAKNSRLGSQRDSNLGPFQGGGGYCWSVLVRERVLTPLWFLSYINGLR